MSIPETLSVVMMVFPDGSTQLLPEDDTQDTTTAVQAAVDAWKAAQPPELRQQHQLAGTCGGLIRMCMLRADFERTAGDTVLLDFLEQHGCDNFQRRGSAVPAERWFDCETMGSDFSPSLRAAVRAARAERLVAQAVREDARRARPASDEEPWVLADDTGLRVTFRDEDAAYRWKAEHGGGGRLVNPTVTFEPATPQVAQAEGHQHG